MNISKKAQLVITSLLIAAPASAQTTYLIIKSTDWSDGARVSLISIPLVSRDQCEEEGAYLTSSERFEIRKTKEVYECIT